jgi:hypothetical protein
MLSTFRGSLNVKRTMAPGSGEDGAAERAICAPAGPANIERHATAVARNVLTSYRLKGSEANSILPFDRGEGFCAPRQAVKR